ncbi:MAG TPA: type IV secretory system conjugative DNA transfer family protein [Roseateles sp.]|uniref:type IV secretory system conjugative DNA transfer family protein n=1 Tax=Roseateles sp. TaxID=1971397 RepID=UPI002ED92472
MSNAPTLAGPAWSVGRKAAAWVFGLVGFLTLAYAGYCLAGALFLVLNKANPTQARPGSIVRYWHLYADDPALRKKLIAAIAIPCALQVAVPAAWVMAARPRRRLHGDARFATVAEIVAAGLTGPNRTSDRRGRGGRNVHNAPGVPGVPGPHSRHGARHTHGGPGILVGRHHGRYLSLAGQLSVMLSAPTRSGKGVSVVIPNLLNWPDSAVVLDIKGENHEITAGYRSAHGQAVYAFSPFDVEARSHRWNPLSAVRTSPLHRAGDLLNIGQVFYPNDGSGTSSEGFFNDQARNLFLGLGLLLLDSPGLPRTLGEMLRQASGKGQSLREHLARTLAARAGTDRPLSAECRDALQRLLSNSDNTMSSIVATFNAPLTLFADAVVDAATSANDFDLGDVRRTRMTVYVRIPPNRLAAARPLLDLFFSQLVDLNTQCLPTQDPTLKYQCLLVDDEFAAMGRVAAIIHAAPYLAGYGLRLLTVIQAMSQLDAIYGDKHARTFATNHGLQILFAPREQRDADDYSAMLGFYTERATSRGRSRSFSAHGHSSVSQNDSEQRRALLMPQEFKELGRHQAVIVMENCKPILAEKLCYFRDRDFKTRLLPAPAVPPMDMALHLARVQERWRYLEGELPPGQHLDVDTLAHDLSQVPDDLEGDPARLAETLMALFAEAPQPAQEGGTVEPLADDDGVLLDEPHRPRSGDGSREPDHL